jgi:beta-glucosidase/6-phospho-beta-glucosidase/beta-galactosidase
MQVEKAWDEDGKKPSIWDTFAHGGESEALAGFRRKRSIPSMVWFESSNSVALVDSGVGYAPDQAPQTSPPTSTTSKGMLLSFPTPPTWCWCRNSVADQTRPAHVVPRLTGDYVMRWQEDVKLMHEMGLDAYRFSIAWTRIIPGSTSYVLQRGVNN